MDEKRGKTISLFIIVFILFLSFISANYFIPDSIPSITGQASKNIKEVDAIEKVKKPAPDPECYDSDGYNNFLVFGYIDYDRERYNDYCEGDIVYDYYCKEGSISLIGKVIQIIGRVVSNNEPLVSTKNCKEYGENYVCLDGKCQKEITLCVDGDNGKDYYTKASISGENENGESIETEDYCDLYNLIEYYCDDSGFVQSEIKECEFGCENGICKSYVPPAPTPSSESNNFVPMANIMNEAEKSLNVKGFDAASAVGTTFSDSINPYSGALTISQTDILIPGRAGMNIQLTKQYNSNIFLHINQKPGQADCIYTNDLCPECAVPDILDASKTMDSRGIYSTTTAIRSMNSCNPSGVDQDPSSYKRAGILGLGWDMDPGKIQDPTAILFKNSNPTYEYVSSRGVNSLKMTIDNNDYSLILPSMYRHNDVSDYADQESIINLDLDNINCAEWSTNLGNPTGEIDGASNSITFLQNYVYPNQNNGFQSYFIDNTFTGYTSSYEPVFLSFYTIGDISQNPGQLGLQQAYYYSKNGNTYFFGNYVPFCGKYDDIRIPNSDSSTCLELSSELLSSNIPNIQEKIARWAENPYAGNYLEYVFDDFGNKITYVYYKDSEGQNTPFIKQIDNGISESPAVYFRYIDENNNLLGEFNSNFNINTRLKYIKFVGPTGQRLYRIYEYDSVDKNLLISSYVSESENGNAIAGTKYEFEYGDKEVLNANQRTKELTKVILPTGAEIEYTYAWNSNIPVNELTRFEGTDFGNSITRRVVAIRTVKNGGYCPVKEIGPEGGKILSGGNSECKWVYQYKKVSGEDIIITLPNQEKKSIPTWTIETTVYDPFGGKTVYYNYAATQNSINTQHFFGANWAQEYEDYVCYAT